MWRSKCPIKAWRCPFAHFVSSLSYNCTPWGAKQRLTGTIYRFRRRYNGPNVTMPHYGIKVPLCPLCAFSIITVHARQWQTFAFRDLNIDENALFFNEKGAWFTLKGHFLLIKKGTFGVLECKRPRPPDSTALVCAPSGAMRKVHGDNFPVPPSLYKGQNVTGLMP